MCIGATGGRRGQVGSAAGMQFSQMAGLQNATFRPEASFSALSPTDQESRISSAETRFNQNPSFLSSFGRQVTQGARRAGFGTSQTSSSSSTPQQTSATQGAIARRLQRRQR